MEHVDIGNPANELHEIPREKMTELDYANLSCQEYREDIQRYKDNRDNAIVKLTIMLDYCTTIGDKEFLSNKLNEIINDLK